MDCLYIAYIKELCRHPCETAHQQDDNEARPVKPLEQEKNNEVYGKLY